MTERHTPVRAPDVETVAVGHPVEATPAQVAVGLGRSTGSGRPEGD